MINKYKTFGIISDMSFRYQYNNFTKTQSNSLSRKISRNLNSVSKCVFIPLTLLDTLLKLREK